LSVVNGAAAWKLRARPRRVRSWGEQAVDGLAAEAHRTGLVDERAADAIDQGRLAGAVGADQADALALGDREIDAVERDEAAEALAQTRDLEQRLGHHFAFLNQPCTSPTMPWGR